MLDLRAIARYWGNIGLLAGIWALAAYGLWAIGGPWTMYGGQAGWG